MKSNQSDRTAIITLAALAMYKSRYFLTSWPHAMLRARGTHVMAAVQYASVTIWFLEQYYGYGVVILIITAVALLVTSWTAHLSQARLARMAAFSCPILVPGTGSSPAPTTISSTDLVPGAELQSLLEHVWMLQCVHWASASLKLHSDGMYCVQFAWCA